MLGQRAPVGVAVLLDVGDEAHVLLRRPGAPVEPHLGAARRSPSPHVSLSLRVLVRLSLLPGSGWMMQSESTAWAGQQGYICAVQAETTAEVTGSAVVALRPSVSVSYLSYL